MQMIQQNNEDSSNLYTFSQSLNGSNPISASASNPSKKLNKTYFELSKVTKLISDNDQFQVGEDETQLKQFLNPFNIQKLI